MNYISALETLEKPWNKPYNGIKWIPCKATLPANPRSSLLINLMLIFFLINIFFMRTVLFQKFFFLNFINHINHFCVLTNLLYSICFSVVLIDFGFKKDGNYYPQVFLKECKYNEREKKVD